MIKTIIDKINLVFKQLKLSKINFLNHKFKKFIVKYEEDGDILRIYNSNGDIKEVKNSIPNKVKVMEIIRDHSAMIKDEIEYYDANREDYKIIILSSSVFLIVLGITFIFSFFVGSYLLFILTLLSFSTTLTMFGLNTYKTILFREEVKRLKSINRNEIVLEDNELFDILKDSLKYIKKYFYDVVLKVINLVDNIKVKFN